MLLRSNHTPYLPSNLSDEDVKRLEDVANRLAQIKALLLNKRQLNSILKQPYWNGADKTFDEKFIGCNKFDGRRLDFAKSTDRSVIIDAIDEELRLLKEELNIRTLPLEKRQYTDHDLMFEFACLPSLGCLFTTKMGSEYRFDGQDIIGLSDLLRLGAYRMFYCLPNCVIGGEYGAFLTRQTPEYFIRGYPGDHVIDFSVIASNEDSYTSIGVKAEYSSSRIYDEVHYHQASDDGFTYIFNVKESREVRGSV